jgi:hypothetical protein
VNAEDNQGPKESDLLREHATERLAARADCTAQVGTNQHSAYLALRNDGRCHVVEAWRAHGKQFERFSA